VALGASLKFRLPWEGDKKLLPIRCPLKRQLEFIPATPSPKVKTANFSLRALVVVYKI
jgi:hypothetical protein